jgi:glycosyltransferase involved in cell wall biosynthesis
MEPLVTIAIPTYNRAKLYLRSCIQSALDQTYSNIEVLISDNCSNDETPEIVQSFSDSRIKYFRQQDNLGQNGNMNFLVEKARGDYFLMYHDDDHIDIDFVETCMKAVEYKSGIGLIVTGSRVINEHGSVNRERKNNAYGCPIDEFILLWYKKGINLFLCNSLFGTDALRQTGGFDATYKHFDDVAAEFSCAAFGGRVDVPDVKASFREHPESGTSSSSIADWCDASLALLGLARRLAPSKDKELKTIGLKTSAERNYRFASEVSSKGEQWKAYWTVLKKFDYRELPPQKYLFILIPSMRYILRPKSTLHGIKNRLISMFGK